MKRKRLDRDKWGFAGFPYYQMRVDMEGFHGLACLIQLADGQYCYWDFLPLAGKIPVCGKGMTWLQLVPDGQKRVITAICTLNRQVSVWYVDVIEGMECDADGVAVFFDKYLDVIFTPQGDIKIDDRDELNAAYQSGELTKEQYDEALTECGLILSELCKDIHKTETLYAKILAEVNERIDRGERPFKENRWEVPMIPWPRLRAGELAPLFAGSTDCLLLSYLQGHMGRAWVDDYQHPACTLVAVGDFYCLGGKPPSPGTKLLAGYLPNDIQLILPPGENWADWLETAHPGQFHKFQRFALKKEPDCFDRARLVSLAEALPDGFQIRRIDGELYRQCLRQDFSRDFCSLFEDEADYLRRGLGFCALKDGEIVSGASSYAVFDQGIEIEVDTRPDCRRLGLATVCSARLILECLARGWYPSWDAHNRLSLGLAVKLGYRFDRAYDTYEVCVDRDQSAGL